MSVLPEIKNLISAQFSVLEVEKKPSNKQKNHPPSQTKPKAKKHSSVIPVFDLVSTRPPPQKKHRMKIYVSEGTLDRNSYYLNLVVTSVLILDISLSKFGGLFNERLCL